MGAARETPCVNRSLISLKVVVFFVITGITALHILHATKPRLLGLNFNEYRHISIIAPFVSIIGPLIAGPLADRLAAKNATNYGRNLRFLTALFLLLSALVYAFLFALPEINLDTERQPRVSFACDGTGGVVFQQRCSNIDTCYDWGEKSGNINLANCTYQCQDPNDHNDLNKFENLYKWLEPSSPTTPLPSTEHNSSETSDYEDENISTATESMLRGQTKHDGPEPAHICLTEYQEGGGSRVKHCHVFTRETQNVVMHATLKGLAVQENDTLAADWCRYPLEGLRCNIPKKQVLNMFNLTKKANCKPMIECTVIDPYNKHSVLADGKCFKTDGYNYVRLIGDIFPMAALTLLNTAIVIAVRETSEGRGEVCRQYAWGAVGYVILFSPLDVLFFKEKTESYAVLTALIVAIVCFVLGALVLLLATKMPLSPPEWWWHTKTGVMVYPMSAIRRYNPEILLLTIVAILFGTFWSSIHSFLRWTFADEYAISSAGLLLVLLLYFNVDKFIEYCGHSNIFITGFAVFIIRFTALSGKDIQWLTIAMEAIEPIVIGVLWITIILYMRHVMPRKLTATGQAIAVLAFFGIGKGCGALIGLVRDDKHPNAEAQEIHQWLAIAAGIIALVYFILYNLILAPRCAAKPQHVEELISGSASQNFNGANAANGAGGNTGGAGAALNGNGNYSPLRVYHNERGKKGQFRF